MVTIKKRVLTAGVFDLFHIGHLRLFKRAKSFGDYLIVAVQDGEYAKKFKPDATILYNNQQRLEMVSSIGCVDEVVTYNTIDELVKKVDYDVLVVGEDQNNDKFKVAIKYSKESNKEIVKLKRTRNISSSLLKDKIDKIFW